MAGANYMGGKRNLARMRTKDRSRKTEKSHFNKKRVELLHKSLLGVQQNTGAATATQREAAIDLLHAVRDSHPTHDAAAQIASQNRSGHLAAHGLATISDCDEENVAREKVHTSRVLDVLDGYPNGLSYRAAIHDILHVSVTGGLVNFRGQHRKANPPTHAFIRRTKSPSPSSSSRIIANNKGYSSATRPTKSWLSNDNERSSSPNFSDSHYDAAAFDSSSSDLEFPSAFNDSSYADLNSYSDPEIDAPFAYSPSARFPLVDVESERYVDSPRPRVGMTEPWRPPLQTGPLSVTSPTWQSYPFQAAARPGGLSSLSHSTIHFQEQAHKTPALELPTQFDEDGYTIQAPEGQRSTVHVGDVFEYDDPWAAVGQVFGLVSSHSIPTRGNSVINEIDNAYRGVGWRTTPAREAGGSPDTFDTKPQQTLYPLTSVDTRLLDHTRLEDPRHLTGSLIPQRNLDIVPNQRKLSADGRLSRNSSPPKYTSRESSEPKQDDLNFEDLFANDEEPSLAMIEPSPSLPPAMTGGFLKEARLRPLSILPIPRVPATTSRTQTMRPLSHWQPQALRRRARRPLPEETHAGSCLGEEEISVTIRGSATDPSHTQVADAPAKLEFHQSERHQHFQVPSASAQETSTIDNDFDLDALFADVVPDEADLHDPPQDTSTKPSAIEPSSTAELIPLLLAGLDMEIV